MIARPEIDCRRVTLGAVFALLVCGCANPELESYYGRHQIPSQSASVNGTDVLAGMFRDAGHQVHFRRTLVTSQMEAADTIVWFPDDFAAPTAEVCEWFDNWLYESPGRRLVFVGRDFDAAPLYWKTMLPRVGADQKRAYELRELEARLTSRAGWNLKTEGLECEWFRYEREAAQDVRELAGPWSGGIDAAKAQIELRTRLIPPGSAGRLLTSGDDLLASRYAEQYWKGSGILLVANGSFLLNLPLVDHQNRKLAGRLIAAAGKPGQVVFLESGPGGPPIDPAFTDNSLWTLFGAWPLNVILLQLAAAGVIFCFARWPIFGRPREPAAESTSDFSLHVAAVGALLARTQDRQFALARVERAEEPGSIAPQPAAATPLTRKAGNRR
jgi:hypothetical protein